MARETGAASQFVVAGGALILHPSIPGNTDIFNASLVTPDERTMLILPTSGIVNRIALASEPHTRNRDTFPSTAEETCVALDVTCTE